MSDPRAVVRSYLDHLEAGDIDGLDEVVAADVVVRRPDGSAAFTDRAAWKEAFREEPFADSKIEIEDVVCENDRVAVRYRLECTQVRPFLGVAPREGRLRTSGTKIYRVRAGKIAEIAGHDDILGLLRELGVVEVEL